MKKLFTLTAIFIGSFLLSCNPCDKVCGPCETLDKDECECVVDIECLCSDGIQNGNETGIDCGGDCDECFDCTTNSCSLLSGATSTETRSNIKWISVYNLNLNAPDDGNWKFNFYSTGTVYETYYGESGSGSWKFDDPSAPTLITITYTETPPYSGNSNVITLLHLEADTLRLHDGYYEFTLIKE